MKRRTPTQIVLSLLPFALGFVMWAIAGKSGNEFAYPIPLLGEMRQNRHSAICQSNLKMIGIALNQYVRDYDERWPIVASAPNPRGVGTTQDGYGWAGILQPYLKPLQPHLKSTELFQCPSERAPSEGDSTKAGYTDYVYNSRLVTTPITLNENSALTVLAFEGTPANARAAAPALPKSWVSNPNSPLYRHLDGANYLFADAHVKWMTPDKIRVVKSSANRGYTFDFR